MKKYLFIISFCFCSNFSVHAEESATPVNNVSDNYQEVNDSDFFRIREIPEEKVYDVAEQMPDFPGGMAALMRYLSTNIKYPVDAEKNGIQGRVIVSFVVEKDGSITNIKVIKSVFPSLDKEAVRLFSSMPKWIPGKQDGSIVRVKFTTPVSFRLQ